MPSERRSRPTTVRGVLADVALVERIRAATATAGSALCPSCVREPARPSGLCSSCTTKRRAA